MASLRLIGFTLLYIFQTIKQVALWEYRFKCTIWSIKALNSVNCTSLRMHCFIRGQNGPRGQRGSQDLRHQCGKVYVGYIYVVAEDS